MSSCCNSNAPVTATNLEGNPVRIAAEPPQVGTQLPDFELVTGDLSEVTLSDFSGQRLIITVFPSVDTGVCARQVAEFNERAASLPNTRVLCVSMDLPFAQGRFCAAEGIENVVTASAFRSSFGKDYGFTMVDGPLRGLLARAVLVADEAGKVIYSQVVPEIKTEPDYDAALAALK